MDQNYLHDPMISYYQQFVQSESSLYFFKFENEGDFEEELETVFGQRDMTIESEIQNGIKQPYLYELSAFSSIPRRVILKDKPVKLQIDSQTS